MRLTTSAQMRALDAEAINTCGIPGIVLMENAARSVFEVCAATEAYNRKKAVIFCGTGNNGGDGFALARHMANDGADVTVVLAGKPEKIAGDAKINFDICRKMGIDIVGAGVLTEAEASAPFVIDALLGTGVSGELRGEIAEAVSFINKRRRAGAFVVSIDCPTGGNPDNGKVSGECVEADITVSLGAIKPGLLLFPLAGYAGRLETGQIGMPPELLSKAKTGLYAHDVYSAAKTLPKRRMRSHKGSYGKAVIIAGGQGMAGAAAYCAKAAYAAGCGYVELCTPKSVAALVLQLAPQAVLTPLSEKEGRVCENSVETALKKINGAAVCLIGPGLGNTPDTAVFVKEIIRNAEIPLIIDADALNAIADAPEILKKARHIPIVTPHPKEMSRLTGLPTDYVLDNMLETANDFSAEYGAVTVLKDAATVIAGENKTFINNRACSALAKAGSGDILAGIVAGLAAQGLNQLDAAALGAYIHSGAGLAAAYKYGEYSVSSEEQLKSIACVMKELSEIAL